MLVIIIKYSIYFNLYLLSILFLYINNKSGRKKTPLIFHSIKGVAISNLYMNSTLSVARLFVGKENTVL
jgi:hypothetical protein